MVEQSAANLFQPVELWNTAAILPVSGQPPQSQLPEYTLACSSSLRNQLWTVSRAMIFRLRWLTDCDIDIPQAATAVPTDSVLWSIYDQTYACLIQSQPMKALALEQSAYRQLSLHREGVWASLWNNFGVQPTGMTIRAWAQASYSQPTRKFRLVWCVGPLDSIFSSCACLPLLLPCAPDILCVPLVRMASILLSWRLPCSPVLFSRNLVTP